MSFVEKQNEMNGGKCNKDSPNASSPPWYTELIDWIRSAGGYVHKALELHEVTESNRGIVCTCGVSKGDLLVRLPSSLALSGDNMPEAYDNGLRQRASPWLRSVAALYQAQNADSKHKPFLQSLPCEYETLLRWSNEEVSEFLGGTALGRAITMDREAKSLESRYATAVRPYLEHLSIVSASQKDDGELERFGQACMCVSTRGFHCQSSADASASDDNGKSSTSTYYSGPFLLPWIDLINHNPSQACTTLKRDADNNFCMIVERDISQGEQVFHSYGTNLTSAQTLQTFGFVPYESVRQAAFGNVVANHHRLTPPVLAVTNILSACRRMVQSGYPQQLTSHVETHFADTVQVWPVTVHESRDWSTLIPDELLVSLPNNVLSDELLTLVCFLLLPDDIFQDFMEDSPSLLDISILDDYFLGKLVCRTLLIAIQEKLNSYSLKDDDGARLKVLCNKKDPSIGEQRAMYGLTIQIEEKASLEALRKYLLELMDSLDDDDTESGSQGDSKRPRIE